MPKPKPDVDITVTSIRVPTNVWKEVRKASIDLEIPLYKILEEALTEWLKKKGRWSEK